MTTLPTVCKRCVHMSYVIAIRLLKYTLKWVLAFGGEHTVTGSRLHNPIAGMLLQQGKYLDLHLQ